MHAMRGVIGIFGDPADAAGAVRALLERGFADVHASVPAAPRALRAKARRTGLAMIGTPRAAIASMLAGIFLAGLTSLAWLAAGRGWPLAFLPLRAQVALVALVYFTLFGSLLNLAVVLTSRSADPGMEVPGPRREVASSPVAVLAYGGDRDFAARILREAGAESVALGRRLWARDSTTLGTPPTQP